MTLIEKYKINVDQIIEEAKDEAKRSFDEERSMFTGICKVLAYNVELAKLDSDFTEKDKLYQLTYSHVVDKIKLSAYIRFYNRILDSDSGFEELGIKNVAFEPLPTNLPNVSPFTPQIAITIQVKYKLI